MKRFFIYVALCGFSLNVWSQNYTLGPGDVVQITVYQHDDLNTRARIGESGTISFPLLGPVRIGNLTEQGAEELVSSLLKRKKIVQAPQVTLFVEEHRSRQVAILGKVSRPGKYPVLQNSTVLDILAEAGGITEDGSEKVIINRRGKSTIVDTSAYLKGGSKVENVYVKNADIIYVPRQDVFYIYGEIQRPGEYPLRSRMTVEQALSVGGGLTNKGTKRGIKVKRRETNNQFRELDVQSTDTLQPNDVIVVKEGLF